MFAIFYRFGSGYQADGAVAHLMGQFQLRKPPEFSVSLYVTSHTPVKSLDLIVCELIFAQ